MMDFFDANLVLVQATFIGLVLALSVQVPLRMGVFSFAGAGSYGIGAYLAGIITIRYETPGIVAVHHHHGVSPRSSACCSGWSSPGWPGSTWPWPPSRSTSSSRSSPSTAATLTGGSDRSLRRARRTSRSTCVIVTLVVLALVAMSEIGRTGRRVDAVRDDPELAASVGISVRRYRLVAFVVSGALGGAAGAMNILVRSTVTPQDIGFGLIVLALTMIIVGGARSWKGAVIGAVIFTWLPELLDVRGRLAAAHLRHHRRAGGDLPPARDPRPLGRLAPGPATAAPARRRPGAPRGWRAMTTTTPARR